MWQAEQYTVFQMWSQPKFAWGRYNIGSLILNPFLMIPSIEFASFTASAHQVNAQFNELSIMTPRSLSWFIIDSSDPLTQRVTLDIGICSVSYVMKVHAKNSFSLFAISMSPLTFPFIPSLFHQLPGRFSAFEIKTFYYLPWWFSHALLIVLFCITHCQLTFLLPEILTNPQATTLSNLQ